MLKWKCPVAILVGVKPCVSQSKYVHLHLPKHLKQSLKRAETDLFPLCMVVAAEKPTWLLNVPRTPKQRGFFIPKTLSYV